MDTTGLSMLFLVTLAYTLTLVTFIFLGSRLLEIFKIPGFADIVSKGDSKIAERRIPKKISALTH